MATDIKSTDRKASFPITVEFSGGLELLFGNERKHSLSVPKSTSANEPYTIGHLVKHLCEDIMQDDRHEMFVLNGGVRPGILVLINDADWELEGSDSYEIQPRDSILFVSTLHGG